MPVRKVTVDLVGEIKPAVFDILRKTARRLRGCTYADLRLEVSEGQVAAAENGAGKFSSRDYGFSFGVRVLAGDGLVAPGYYGQALGATDLPHLAKILRAGLRHAHGRALANARRKAAARKRFGPLAASLASTALAPIEVHQTTLPAEFRIDPRSVPLDEVTRLAVEVSRAVQGVDRQVMFNFVSSATMLSRELFVSTEGANIDQGFALTQGSCVVVAQGESASQELDDYLGHQRGWEILTEGVREEYIQYPDFLTFATRLARDAVTLAHSPSVPATEKEVVVVTDPHYNALVAHEVVGHPTELDRALKMEAAYAGRSWLLRNLDETQVGKQIASPLVTAYSDPSLPGFGHYAYDDEGTPARRVVHIERGIFRGFANSRQTAAILGVEPNGSYKATDASLVPLIRMSNTVFGAGERDPQAILREVDRGYYVAGHRIPSIAESRENFRISAMKVYEIRKGELGRLYRDGAVMADTRDYFIKVDAVGNDFRLFPVPNCGKGQPMQTRRLGNGGPTMRSRARLTGASR